MNSLFQSLRLTDWLSDISMTGSLQHLRRGPRVCNVHIKFNVLFCPSSEKAREREKSLSKKRQIKKTQKGGNRSIFYDRILWRKKSGKSNFPLCRSSHSQDITKNNVSWEFWTTLYKFFQILSWTRMGIIESFLLLLYMHVKAHSVDCKSHNHSRNATVAGAGCRDRLDTRPRGPIDKRYEEWRSLATAA
jgi:hypothetical protein